MQKRKRLIAWLRARGYSPYLQQWVLHCGLYGHRADELSGAVAWLVALSSLGALVGALLLGASVPFAASSLGLYLALAAAAVVGVALIAEDLPLSFGRLLVFPLANTAGIALSATAVAAAFPGVFHPWVVVFVSLSLLLLSFGLQLCMAHSTHVQVVNYRSERKTKAEAARALEAPVASGGPLVIEVSAPPHQGQVNVAVQSKDSSTPAQLPQDTFGHWAKNLEPGLVFLLREATLEPRATPAGYRDVTLSYELVGCSEPEWVGENGKVDLRTNTWARMVTAGLKVQAGFAALVLVVALGLSWGVTVWLV